MIQLSDISTPHSMRTYLNNVLSEIDHSIYPLNTFFAHHIRLKNFPYLKDFVSNNPSNTLTIEDYKSLNSQLTSEEISFARQWIELNCPQYLSFLPYIFIGSRNNFRAAFADALPSTFDAIYNYLISNDYIKQIGTGLGNAQMFNSSIFDSSFEDYSVPQSDYSSVLTSIINEVKSLKSDKDYLFQLLENQEQYINKLLAEIQSLRQQNQIAYQMTWR